jgi:predicted RNase H-like HicB family nuclease
MNLKAIIHTAEEGGYWAEVPALPGCMTQGETIAEVQENLREAVDLWLSVEETELPLSPTDTIYELAV